MLTMPERFSFSTITLPTPGILLTLRGRRKAASPPG